MQGFLQISSGRVVLVFSVETVVEVGLLIVKETVGVKVAVFEGVLARAVEKDLALVRNPEKFDKVGRRDHEFGNCWVFAASLDEVTVSASPDIKVVQTGVGLFVDIFSASPWLPEPDEVVAILNL